MMGEKHVNKQDVLDKWNTRLKNRVDDSFFVFIPLLSSKIRIQAIMKRKRTKENEHMQPLKKVYRYHQLNEEAKKIAVNNVYEREAPFFENDEFVHEQLTKTVIHLLEKIQLTIKKEEIEWESHYSFSLDISETEEGINDFYKTHLSPDDYDTFCDMQELLEDVMEVSLFGRDNEEGICIEPNVDAFDIDEEDELAVAHFIVRHTEDEELVNKYRLLLLFAEASEDNVEAFPEHILEDLNADLIVTVQHQAKHLEKILNVMLEPKYDEIYQAAKGIVEYGGSDEFYKNELESSGCTIEQRYLFDTDGKIILIDDDFVQSDYIEIYEEHAVV